MKIYVVSDTHFGHDFLKSLGVRPDNYEKKFWDSWSKLKSGDLLIHLGDLAFTGNTPMGQMIHAMPGKKILIRGNHDQGYEKYYKMGFDAVVDEMRLEYSGRQIIFSHKPVFWVQDYLNIHGHLHGDHHRLEGELEWYKDMDGKPLKDYYVDLAPEIWGCRVISLVEILKKHEKTRSK